MWLSDFIGIVALVGLLWKFVIKPQLVKFLQDTVVEPQEQVLKMLTKNGGKNNPPTVPDIFDQVFKRLDDQDELAERREANFEAWRTEHMAWAEDLEAKQDKRIDGLEAIIKETK